MDIQCRQCGKLIVDKKHKNRIFCSLQCVGEYKKGRKYILHKENPTSFKKSNTPWNKGTKGLMVAWNKGIKGTHFSPQTEFKAGQNVGADNNKWRGEYVGYGNLYGWLYRNLEKTGTCTNCGKETSTHWANISREYKREFEDFIELCPKCHSQYDHNLISIKYA